ncbi:MAG: hypothetical protein EOO44_11410 [Flavobacterium sp.]|nr:MAG: hypothetical protein EOO44_11410 [Flavobacterium sp.]
MKLRKGQKVIYTAASGNFYNATIIETKTEFTQCVVKRNSNFYYVIQLDHQNSSMPIICCEQSLSIKENKYNVRKKLEEFRSTPYQELQSENLFPELLSTFTPSRKVKDK